MVSHLIRLFIPSILFHLNFHVFFTSSALRRTFCLVLFIINTLLTSLYSMLHHCQTVKRYQWDWIELRCCKLWCDSLEGAVIQLAFGFLRRTTTSKECCCCTLVELQWQTDMYTDIQHWLLATFGSWRVNNKSTVIVIYWYGNQSNAWLSLRCLVDPILSERCYITGGRRLVHTTWNRGSSKYNLVNHLLTVLKPSLLSGIGQQPAITNKVMSLFQTNRQPNKLIATVIKLVVLAREAECPITDQWSEEETSSHLSQAGRFILVNSYM